MNIANKTVINEIKSSTENFRKALGQKYPGSIPVLLFIASQTCKQISQWYDLHTEVIENEENSKIVTIEGAHALYRQHAKEIVETFQNFMLYASH